MGKEKNHINLVVIGHVGACLWVARPLRWLLAAAALAVRAVRTTPTLTGL